MEMHGHPDQDRHGQGHSPAAPLGHPLARRHLVSVGVGPRRVDGQHVPVKRTPGGQRHGGHQVDLLVAEAVETAVRHPLQGRTWVLGAHPGQSHHFVIGGHPGRHRDSVAVGVGERPRRGKAQATGGQCLAQQALHLSQLVVGGLTGHRVVLHDRPSQRTVSDHGSHVHPDVAVQAAQVVSERPPLPVNAQLQGSR